MSTRYPPFTPPLVYTEMHTHLAASPPPTAVTSFVTNALPHAQTLTPPPTRERAEMAIARASLGVALVVVVVVLAIAFPAVQAQITSPAPSPASDGVSIDQGIAYILMLAALVLTYLIHPLDASSYRVA